MKPKYQPIKKTIKKQFQQVIGAFDIETVPPDGETDARYALFGEYADGFLKYDDDPTMYRADTIDAMLDQILSRGNVILYAHNAKGYEFNYLLDALRAYPEELKIECLLQGESGFMAIFIDHPDGKIELRDSMALIPMSLKKACEALKTDIQKGDIGLAEGEVYDRENLEHMKYCIDDVKATIQCVRKIIDLTHQVFGCGIGFSTAGTAMACFKATIDEGCTYWRMTNARVEKFAREGYYGGFVYPGRDMHPHDNVLSIDRNASFAGSMREGVPGGKPRVAFDMHAGKPGIFRCQVEAVNVTIPCIPYRNPKGTLLWPTGKFTTVITTEEIVFARAQGYKIEIIHGLEWDYLEYPFNTIVDLCERIEREQPLLKPFIKLIRNALYGKFGMHLMIREVMIGMPVDPTGWAPLTNEETGEINFHAWTREVPNTANYLMPHWAAFITARARLWMFRTMLTVGMDYVYYGDTDSVKGARSRMLDCIANGLIDVRPGVYGAAKPDEDYIWFQAMGPKVYHGRLMTPTCKEGKPCTGFKENGIHSCQDKFRAKGIPGKCLSHELFDKAYYHKTFESVHFMQSNGTMIRLKKPKLGMLRGTADGKLGNGRKLTDFRNSETWVVSDDGTINPPVV